MEPPGHRPAKRYRMRLAVYAAALVLGLWLARIVIGGTAAGGGAALRADRGFKRVPIPHQQTATCRVAGFRKRDDVRRCSDPYAHPFSGCLTDGYEADTFSRLLAGSQVRYLRCGFLDAASQRWLGDLHDRFSGCTHVVFTVSFSYGELPTTKGVAAGQPGACFVAFVDAAAREQLQGAAGYNGSHYGRWELVGVEHKMFSDGMARSAHMIKILAPRLFPAASAALYIDIKVSSPAGGGASAAGPAI